MCSTNHSNWVTFEDDNTPLPSPQKPLQSPGFIKASVPRPNGLKLVLPPIRDTSWSFSSSLESPQSHSGLSGSSCAPYNTPFSTPLSGVPSSNDFLRCLSSTSTSCASSPAPEAPNKTSDGPSPFPSFQGNSGHYNPFWDGSGLDGSEPPRDQLQNTFSYVCHKLESLQTETDPETATEHDGERRLGCKYEVLSEVASQFVPRGLFRSQKRDGWSVMLRIPEKKNRMSSRQWGPIYLRLLPGGVLQMYYEKGLEKPYKELQLLPQCRLSDLKLESYGEPRKVLTVRVEHFSFTEKKRYHPKLEVSHEAEADQLLKFGSTVHDDMEDLVVSMEEEIFKLCMPHQQRRHYEEQELSLQITDHIWVQLDKSGGVIERTAFTQIHCLAFLNGLGECFLALNDLGLLRYDSSYGSEEGSELWMEIADCHFHKCVNESEFQRSRLIKFSPPDACRVELMRYKTTTLGSTEIPFSIKAVVTVQGAYVELQAFLNMSATFLSSVGGSDRYPVCENVVIRVPVPGDWVKVTQTVALLRQKSLKARMNRNACLGSVGTANSQPVMQVSIGTVKYENVYSAIVWRIERLPAKNMAVDHPHSFSCKLELGSDQEIPDDWYPFVTMECEIMGSVVSQTRVKSLGTANDIQPQKHSTSWTRYHCQAKLYLSIIDDVIESMRELFLDEGLEDRVLDDLRHLWESKMMQSKAMEDFRKNNISSSNFVLQLPDNYRQSADRELTGNGRHQMMNAVGQTKSSLMTQSYPVQIPAGVTLQTASGQLYKVNVPVVVTQAPAGQQPVSRPTQKAPAPQPTAVPPNTIYPQQVEPPPVHAASDTELPQHYSELSDIVQLDGAADNSDVEVDDGVPLEVNDFLGIINAEAIKVLQEGDGSSDGNSISSSDSEGADKNAEEEDPLNSGDDVIEQDIPDLFDTDNVIVCQYDKIHRSKNRWKFHLKDGVMCYAGRDYVFSKAVGEAEW
uniref:Stonin 1 n=1 Tax=Scophthalmus maximus TaxID=52904 RepID=A0A8D3DJT9_SCOMX